MKTTVAHVDTYRPIDGAVAVYIGRPSRWGNPIRLRREEDRQEVIHLFEMYLVRNPGLIAAVKRELKGKVLLCHCFPRACHGDVLAKYADQ